MSMARKPATSSGSRRNTWKLPAIVFCTSATSLEMLESTSPFRFWLNQPTGREAILEKRALRMFFIRRVSRLTIILCERYLHTLETRLAATIAPHTNSSPLMRPSERMIEERNQLNHEVTQSTEKANPGRASGAAAALSSNRTVSSGPRRP